MRRLTPTSYVVLGLLAAYGPATSYELKKRAADTVGNFWIFVHSQLYNEPPRHAEDGLVTEEAEQGGRRRRVYHITDHGRAEVAAWLADPTPGKTEVRDPGLLKLFFGGLGSPADMAQLARDQQEAHRSRAEEHEATRAAVSELADRWQIAALDLGILFERTIENFWHDFLASLATSNN